MCEVELPMDLAMNGAILIYHQVVDNQLVELYLLCHGEPLYKVFAAPFLTQALPLPLNFLCLPQDKAGKYQDKCRL